ncbi:MAG: hypothetical protein KC496_00790 [Anaerolineae bacterium]|nr:hypothetical protein [Anaerolineae bacterium]
MESPLPANADIIGYGEEVPWQAIEQQKRRFNDRLKQLAKEMTDDEIPLDDLSKAAGIPISVVYDDSSVGNVLLGHVGDKSYILGSCVSKRYRYGQTFVKSVVPYNFNPSVNHTNLHETQNPHAEMRALGAELELGVYHPDGSEPTEDELQNYAELYRNSASMLGITPQVDREACAYQVEVHVAPGIGYNRTRLSIEAIMKSLVHASQQTGLYTAIYSAFPLLSRFKLTDHYKVHTAVDLMCDINSQFPEYEARMEVARQRYHMDPDANVVQIFRLQGCHIHLDIAGRSEALGLFTFYTMLRSATAIANAAILKGGPFVNGTCDPELLCTREYLRSTTVTGRYLDLPLTPHLSEDGLGRYTGLLHTERANAPARALLCEGGLGEDISVMHNPIGRVRPDLGSTKRICTVESTGMPVNISASRQAAALSDFEFTHILVENYYRKHGTDLRPMQDDEVLWAIVGPLGTPKYKELQDLSDRHGSDVTIETATGKTMTLPEFYEMKRLYMHKHLIDVPGVAPRDIDEVYMSMNRMLAPPSGRVAQTPEEYVEDPTRRSTGNWGKILRDAFIEEGGTPGEHNPDAVLRVTNRVHEALVKRYS